MSERDQSAVKGKVITIPFVELPTTAEALLKDVDEAGRLLADAERQAFRDNLLHYTIDVDEPVWVSRPSDVIDAVRFTERPDLVAQ
jgi:hypothetical protein